MWFKSKMQSENKGKLLYEILKTRLILFTWMNVSTRPMLSLEGYSRRLSHFGCEERRDPRTRPGDQRLRAGPPAPLLQRREQRLAGRSGRNCFKLDVTRRKHDVSPTK